MSRPLFIVFLILFQGNLSLERAAAAALDLTAESGSSQANLEAGTYGNLVYQAKISGLGGPATLASFSWRNPTLYGSPWDAVEPQDIAADSVTLYYAAAPATTLASAIPVAKLSSQGSVDPLNRTWSASGLSLALADDDRLFITLGTTDPSPGVRALRATVGAGAVTLSDGSSGPPADRAAAQDQFLRPDRPLTVAAAASLNNGLRYVSGGDASVTLMQVLLSHNQSGAAGGELHQLILTFRDGAGNPTDPVSLIAGLAVQDLYGGSLALISDIAAASAGPGRLVVPLDALYPTGALVPQGGSTSLFLSASLVASPSPTFFRAEIAGSVDADLRDEWTGSPALLTAASFPLLGASLAVKPAAEELALDLDGGATGGIAGRGLGGLLLGSLVLSQPAWAPLNVGDVEVTEVSLDVSDGSGNPLVPASVFSRLRLQNDLALYVEKAGAAVEGSGSEVMLPLFTPIRVQRGKPMTVELRADIQPGTLAAAFQVGVIQGASGSATVTAQVLAEDANRGSAVTVISPVGGSFPRLSKVFQVVNAMKVSHQDLIPGSVYEGQDGLPLMDLILDNPSPLAGALILQSLSLRCLDGQGLPVAARKAFSALRLKESASVLAQAAGLSSSASLAALTLSAPLTLVYGSPRTLRLEGDLARNQGLDGLGIRLDGAAQIQTQHSSDPIPVLVEAAPPDLFPMVCGPGLLKAGDLEHLENYPNPFAAGRTVTRIPLYLPDAARISAEILGTDGEPVIRLAWKEAREAGPVELSWDGRNGRGQVVANGVYLLKVSVEGPDGTKSRLRKIGVLK